MKTRSHIATAKSGEQAIKSGLVPDQKNILPVPLPAQAENEDEGDDARSRNGFFKNFLTWIKPSKRNANGNSTRSNLDDVLDSANGEASDFSPEEKAMFNSVLRLREIRVEELMVPRAEIIAIDMQTSLAELLEIFEQSGHSRMPIYNENLDDPRGMVHIRDILGYITRTASQDEKRRSNGKAKVTPKPDLKCVDLSLPLAQLNLARNILFVPPSMMAADLMDRMQATRTQIALVIDEYGGTDGLISLEDIVEIIVGDIEDEHDNEDELINRLDDGRLICDARAEIEEVDAALGIRLDIGEHGEDADTIGGVIFSLLGRVPLKGEIIDAFGYEFHIREADPRRIKVIEIVPSKKTVRRKAK